MGYALVRPPSPMLPRTRRRFRPPDPRLTHPHPHTRSQYVGSFLSYNINANGNFVVAAGAIRTSPPSLTLAPVRVGQVLTPGFAGLPPRGPPVLAVGVCAGMLWTAQGAATLAYATESTKGRLFATFW